MWHIGTISPTSDVLISDVPGMFNPKLNAAKNGIIGLVLLAWFFIAQYYGQRLRTLLKSASGATAADRKIQQYLGGLSFCIFMGFGYKFLYAFLRMSKDVGMLEKPPCSTPWVSILCILYNLVTYIACEIMRPGKKVASKVSPSTTSRSTAVSSAS